MNPLLDQPAATPEEIAALEAGMARLVGGDRDVVLVPAEAILALEAIAASVAAPGRRALIAGLRTAAVRGPAAPTPAASACTDARAP